MLVLALFVLICTLIGSAVGHPWAGLIVGILLALLGVYNEVRV